jgi:hypothetical protein
MALRSIQPLTRMSTSNLHTIRGRKANWIGHILRRNCLLSHIIEGKIIGQEGEEGDVSSCWVT